MEDFYYAGGLPVVIKELLPVLNKECGCVNGKTIEANYSKIECFNPECDRYYRKNPLINYQEWL